MLFILRAMMGEAEAAELTSPWFIERGGLCRGALTEYRVCGLGELCGLGIVALAWSCTFRGSTWTDLGVIELDRRLF